MSIVGRKPVQLRYVRSRAEIYSRRPHDLCDVTRMLYEREKLLNSPLPPLSRVTQTFPDYRCPAFTSRYLEIQNFRDDENPLSKKGSSVFGSAPP